MDIKTLNFKEVIANIKEGEVYETTSDDILEKIFMKDRIIDFKFTSSAIKERNFGVSDKFAKYIKVQQPVAFEEVLNSNKMCRVEHEIIKNKAPEVTCFDGELRDNLQKCWNKLLSEKYMNLGEVMYALSFRVTADVQEIIKNGKWYLDEV